MAIARWTSVPYRDITAPTKFGVVAFHRNGIAKVSFSWENGAWVDVTTMTYNADTNLWEYCVQIDPTASGDSFDELRAIVYPNVGMCKLLQGDDNDGHHQSMFFNTATGGVFSNPTAIWADASAGNDTTGNGSQGSPYATIQRCLQGFGGTPDSGDADGLVVYLKAGSYQWPGAGNWPTPSTVNRWLTITKDPAALRSAVIIASQASGGTEGTQTFLTRLHQIHVRTAFRSTNGSNSPPEYPKLWLDACEISNAGGINSEDWGGGATALHYGFSNFSYAAATDCLYHDCCFASTQYDMIRGCTFNNTSGDPLPNCYFCADIDITNFDGSGVVGNHPDMFSWDWASTSKDPADNVIGYCIRAYGYNAQGLHVKESSAGPVSNFAFVNIALAAYAGETFTCTGPYYDADHILYWNVTVSEQSFRLIKDSAYTWSNVQVRNCSFWEFHVETDGIEQSAVPTGAELDNFNLETATTPPGSIGTNRTVGDPLYTDTGTYDIHLDAGSPCDDRGTPLVACDADGVARNANSAIGAYEL